MSLRFRHGSTEAYHIFERWKEEEEPDKNIWEDKRGWRFGPQSLAREWLKRQGWEEDNGVEWVWNHREANRSISRRRGVEGTYPTWYLKEMNKDELSHFMRDAWRASCWAKFKKKGKTRSERCRGVSWGEARNDWDHTRWKIKKMRAVPMLCNHMMAIAVGAYVSDAKLQKGSTGEVSHFCPRCKEEVVPDQYHEWWGCKADDEHRKERRPTTIVGRELGWLEYPDDDRLEYLGGLRGRRLKSRHEESEGCDGATFDDDVTVGDGVE